MNITPEMKAFIETMVAWLWAAYGKRAVERLGTELVTEARWTKSVSDYLDSLYQEVGFIRIIGQMEWVPLEDVFTDVNLLDKITAEQRYDIERLSEELAPRSFRLYGGVKRVNGDEAVAAHDLLFVLGKPGAGKTTFLKHTAMRAIRGEMRKVPLFISLNELARSGKPLVPYIVHKLEAHGVPAAADFAEALLEGGDALVLLDGLDEVTVADEKRSRLIDEINDFVTRHRTCSIVMSCRVATTDYSFPQFTYVEVADFTEAQIRRYIQLWFRDDSVKQQRCKADLFSQQNEPIRELAQTPLLLSMLCLTYGELGEFPANRGEIYDEAMRALLVKWDSSRNLRRDDFYRKLSLKQKEGLLTHIAGHAFAAGDYFLPERKLVRQIEGYLEKLPGMEQADGLDALRALESQHGILVERAARIHSFAHLTFQEYFAARHIVDGEARGSLSELIQHVGDPRWDEVFLLVAARLSDATEFARQYRAALDDLIQRDSQLVSCLVWVEQKRAGTPPAYHSAAMRSFYNYLALARDRARARARALALARDLDLALARDLALDLDLARARARARALDLDLDLALDRDLALDIARSYGASDFEAALLALPPLSPASDDLKALRAWLSEFNSVLDRHRAVWDPFEKLPVIPEELDERWKLSESQLELWSTYLTATHHLVRCLAVATLPRAERERIEDSLLLPPA